MTITKNPKITKTPNYVTIDMSSHTFKFVEYDSLTQQIVSLSTLSLTARDLFSKEILNKIKKWCLSNLHDSNASVSVLLSLKDVILHTPSMIKSFNVEEQIEWELTKYIGHSLEDYSWGYHIVKETEMEKWAMAIACRDSVIKRITQLLPVEKLNLKHISIDVFGAMNYFEKTQDPKFLRSSLILVVYEEDVYMLQVEDYQIDDFYWAPLDESVNRFNYLDKEAVLHKAFEGVTSFLMENNLSHSQKKIIVLGNLSILPAFKKTLRDHFLNEIIIPSLDDVVLSENLADKKNISKSGGLFCSAIGNNFMGASF